MKTLTLVINFMLLGLIGFATLLDGLSHEKHSVILILMALGVTIMNVVLNAGSSFNPDRAVINEKKSEYHWFKITKIIAVIINIILLGYAFWYIDVYVPRSPGAVNFIIIFFVLMAPFINMVRIAASRWDRFRGMKRTALLTALSLFIPIFLFFTAMRIMIGHGIKENISIAKKEHPGRAEDALLAYLADSTKTYREKNQIAVWTLGQIRSRKALPVLKSHYRNNPYYHCDHNTELCQYELHKAIVSIERGWMGAKEKNVFGSWSRLNR